MPIGVSSAPYAKFVNPGDRHGGEIVGFRVVQNIDQKTRTPLYLQQNLDGTWAKSFSAFGPGGKPNDPITQWEITVDTEMEDENGDTERRIFVDPRKGRRGTTTAGKRGGDAVANALKKAKAHRIGIEIGGTFFLIYDGKVDDGENKVNTWSAEYQAPSGGPGTGTPVDEVPWLVGGGRYNKAAELARWEASRAPGIAAAPAQQTEPAYAPPATQTLPGVDPQVTAQKAASQAAATDRITNRQPSVRASVTGTWDDEPPF
jgi:hypothetical protein